MILTIGLLLLALGVIGIDVGTNGLLIYVQKSGSGGAGTGSKLLLENGDKLLLEDGSFLLLE